MPVAKWSLILRPRHFRLKCCCTLGCTFNQGKMASMEAPQHTAYNEGCSYLLEGRLWSTGSAFQVQISEQNFDLKDIFWILNSLTDTEQIPGDRSNRKQKAVTQKAQGLYRNRREKYLCCARDRTLLGIQRVTCGNARKGKDIYLAF